MGAAALAALRAALQRLSPQMLGQLASKLSAATGKVIPASVQGILTSIQTFAKNHPTKFAVALQVVVMFIPGLDVDDILGDVLGDTEETAAILKKIHETRERVARENAGDGDADTIFEMDKSDVKTAIVGFRDSKQIFDRAVSAMGGAKALKAVQEALSLDPDVLKVLYGDHGI